MIEKSYFTGDGNRQGVGLSTCLSCFFVNFVKLNDIILLLLKYKGFNFPYSSQVLRLHSQSQKMNGFTSKLFEVETIFSIYYFCTFKFGE